MPDERVVLRDWLKALAALGTANLPKAELAAKLDAYVPMLLGEFPIGAFSAASLAHVARNANAAGFFPSFAELANALGPWWKEHRPPPSQPTIGYERPVGSEREREQAREAADSWRGITPEQIRAKLRALDGHPMQLLLGRILATGLRKHAPQHLGLLPPQWLAPSDDRGSVVMMRKAANEP